MNHRQATIESAYQIPGWMWPTELGWLYDNFQHSKSHLEIGTYCGKSLFVTACAMAKRNDTPLCVGVDPMGFTSIGANWEIGVLKSTLTEIQNRHKIDLQWWKETSVEAMFEAMEKKLKFDSLFIDGCHELAETQADIEGWLPFLKPGGLIAGHDYWPKHPGVMEAVSNIFGGDFQVAPQTRIWWKRLSSETNVPL